VSDEVRYITTPTRTPPKKLSPHTIATSRMMAIQRMPRALSVTRENGPAPEAMCQTRVARTLRGQKDAAFAREA